MRRGFTIVELIVAIALFATLTAIGVGGYVQALRIQRQAQVLLAAESNASLALEQMTREIRTGSDFSVLTSGNQKAGSGQGASLSFTNDHGDQVTYSLWRQSVRRQSVAASAVLPITSNNAAITYLAFDLEGNELRAPNDGYPPRVTITMGVSPSSTDAGLAGIVTKLQATVSVRQTDDEPPSLTLYKTVKGGANQSSDFWVWVSGVNVRPCGAEPDFLVNAKYAPGQNGFPGAPASQTADKPAPITCYYAGSAQGTVVTFAPDTNFAADEVPGGTTGVDAQGKAVSIPSGYTEGTAGTCSGTPTWGQNLSCVIQNAK